LAELRSLQFTVQFLPAAKDDLEQLPAAILQIPRKADLFQSFPIQVVGLVHNLHNKKIRGLNM
jgi:hypothetical protein